MMSDFLHMGGYGFFVWGSYGFTLLLLLFCALHCYRQHRKLLKQIRQQAQTQEIQS